jgi:CO dehydrogenase/acetyl-CoA synthase gamma subunit (corrinoid Fe-S protein)
MIDAHRVDGYCVSMPFRLKIDGEVVRNKKGEPKKFHSMMEAISYGQRLLEKRKHGGK